MSSDPINSTVITSPFGVLLLEPTVLRCRCLESRSQAAALHIAQKLSSQAPGI